MSMLDRVHKGPNDVPDRIMVVGTEGVGKSTFASESKSPLFLCETDGVHHLDTSSLTLDTLEQVMATLTELRNTEHQYETLVIDTVDWLEPLIWDAVCKTNNWANIETPGWGKGHRAAEVLWRQLLTAFDRLRHEKGMEVILIAHSVVRMFYNPEGDDYSRFELPLYKETSPLLKQWCDNVLFAAHEEFAVEKGGRMKGVSTGHRVLHTYRTASRDAKSRWVLPAEIEMVEGESYRAYDRSRALNKLEAAELHGRCVALADTLPKKNQVMLDFIEANKDNRKRLVVTLNRLHQLASAPAPADK